MTFPIGQVGRYEYNVSISIADTFTVKDRDKPTKEVLIAGKPTLVSNFRREHWIVLEATQFYCYGPLSHQMQNSNYRHISMTRLDALCEVLYKMHHKHAGLSDLEPFFQSADDTYMECLAYRAELAKVKEDLFEFESF